MPCHILHVYCSLGANKTSTREFPSKNVSSLVQLASQDARVPPRGGGMEAKREKAIIRASAKALGVVPICRPPAAHTPIARSVSLPSAHRSALEFLHNIPGVVKRFLLAAFRLITTSSLAAGQILLSRINDLLPYSSFASAFRTFNEIATTGVRIEAFVFLDMLLVMPMLIEGLLPDNQKLIDDITFASLALQRLVVSLRQPVITENDCVRIRREAVVAVRLLRVFTFMRKTIKLHFLLHFSTMIPKSGPPRGIGDTEETEAFMVVIKRLHRRTAGLIREPGMLKLYSQQRALTLLLAAIAVRRGEDFPLNRSGIIMPAVPTELVNIVNTSTIPTLVNLGGFVTDAFANQSRLFSVTGRGDGAKAPRVKGAGGVAVTEVPWSKPLVREILFAAGRFPGLLLNRAGLIAATMEGRRTFAW